MFIWLGSFLSMLSIVDGIATWITTIYDEQVFYASNERGSSPNKHNVIRLEGLELSLKNGLIGKYYWTVLYAYIMIAERDKQKESKYTSAKQSFCWGSLKTFHPKLTSFPAHES